MRAGGALLTAWELLRPMLKNRKSLCGLLGLLFFVGMATVGPLIVPLQIGMEFGRRYLPPSLEHPLGTDYFGNDILQQLVHGAPTTLGLAATIALFATLIATVVGVASGYVGGVAGRALDFLTSIFLTIPSFPAMLILFVALGETHWLVAAAVMALWMWAGAAKSIKAAVYRVRFAPFVEAAENLNLGTPHILFKEIMPHVVPYIFINFVSTFRAALEASVGLMFLGALKYNPLHWGVMLNLAIFQTGSIYIARAIHYPLSIMAFVALLLFFTTLLSYGVEEAFRPELRGYE
jgi:peptide/nickel transport system permease protein